MELPTPHDILSPPAQTSSQQVDVPGSAGNLRGNLAIWMWAVAIGAFFQAVMTIVNLIPDITSTQMGVVITSAAEAILFVGFGIAHLQRRIWGTYCLLGLSLLELGFRLAMSNTVTFTFLYTSAVAITSIKLLKDRSTEESHERPTAKVIALYGFYVLAAGGLTGFMYGFMGFKQMQTRPTFWITSCALAIVVYVHAARQYLPRSFETVVSISVVATFMAAIVEVPTYYYQTHSWAQAWQAMLSSGIVTMSYAMFAWGLASTWPTVPPISVGQGRNYITAHWYGQHSLVRSFWVNTVAFNLVLGFLSRYLDRLPLITESPQLEVISSFIFLTAITLTGIWQLVGLWRSADHHKRVFHKALWPNITKGYVLAAGIVLLALTPLIVELGKSGLGLDYMGASTAAITTTKDELVLNGPLTLGTSAAVEKELKRTPGIKTIRLNSPGGYVAEGERLKRLISTYELITYTSTGCQSACAEAFLAGRIRVLRDGATIGFHQASFANLPHSWFASFERPMIDRLAAVGASKEFIQKVLTTPNDQLWSPSTNDLVREGIVTHTHKDGKITDWTRSDTEREHSSTIK